MPELAPAGLSDLTTLPYRGVLPPTRGRHAHSHPDRHSLHPDCHPDSHPCCRFLRHPLTVEEIMSKLFIEDLALEGKR
ncbi:MAG TPA: hypothetical protein PK279_05130, partial [Accumulibacter sp.]|nr:hypothetical protein [Accumulibacter sp.]